ncbi:hypothetical protein GALL_268000 [mine drainage metagenome]|uniref:Lipoprotein n=1 Tax=mine drainage metagenome TaxID=410659 RepID=A0A1J5RP40_9ZZZZ
MSVKRFLPLLLLGTLAASLEGCGIVGGIAYAVKSGETAAEAANQRQTAPAATATATPQDQPDQPPPPVPAAAPRQDVSVQPLN